MRLTVLLLAACVAGPAWATGTPAGTSLRDSGVLVSVDTGSSLDAGALLAYAAAYTPVRGADYTLWSRPLDDYRATFVGDGVGLWGGYPDWWNGFPTGITVTYVMTDTGRLYAGASGSTAGMLALLSEGGLSSQGIWGAPITAPAVAPMLYPALDPRGTLLASLLFVEYQGFRQAGAVDLEPNLSWAVGTPFPGTALEGFERLPAHLSVTLGPVTGTQAGLAMIMGNTAWACGCAFDGTLFSAGPWWPLWQTFNDASNPKATDITLGAGQRVVQLTSSGEASFFSAQAFGDNSNSGSVTVDGTVVSTFTNWSSASREYHDAGTFPSTVQLDLTNNWSQSRAWFRLVVLDGGIAVLGQAVSPDAGAARLLLPTVQSVHPVRLCGTALDCDDGDPCTFDSCDQVTWECLNLAGACGSDGGSSDGGSSDGGSSDGGSSDGGSSDGGSSDSGTADGGGSGGGVGGGAGGGGSGGGAGGGGGGGGAPLQGHYLLGCSCQSWPTGLGAAVLVLLGVGRRRQV